MKYRWRLMHLQVQYKHLALKSQQRKPHIYVLPSIFFELRDVASSIQWPMSLCRFTHSTMTCSGFLYALLQGCVLGLVRMYSQSLKCHLFEGGIPGELPRPCHLRANLCLSLHGTPCVMDHFIIATHTERSVEADTTSREIEKLNSFAPGPQKSQVNYIQYSILTCILCNVCHFHSYHFSMSIFTTSPETISQRQERFGGTIVRTRFYGVPYRQRLPRRLAYYHS